MERILLTIEGPRERMEVAVPADVPVANVMPMVRDLCAPGEANGGLTIGLLGYGALPPDRSLSDLGVEEGAVLYLCRPDGSAWGREPVPAEQWTPPSPDSDPWAEVPGPEEWQAAVDLPAVPAAPAVPVVPAAPAPAGVAAAAAAGSGEPAADPPAVPAAWTPPEPAPSAAGPVPDARGAWTPAPTEPGAWQPPQASGGPGSRAPDPGPGATADAAPVAGHQAGARPPEPDAPPPQSQLPVPVPPALVVAVPVSPPGRRRPQPVPLGERVRGATAAFVSPAAAAPVPTLSPAGPTPEMLARRRGDGRVKRARTAWQSSDYRRRLDEAIAAPRLSHCATIAVASPKGGVGKTVISALLGTLLARVRNDRVIAVDSNPDHGTLGRSLTPNHPVFVDDLAGVLEHPALTATLLDGSLGRAAHGLMVLPAPVDPERMMRLDADSYARVIERLQTLAGILVLDCGAGLYSPPTQAVLDGADEIVLVTDSDPLTASVVVEAARRLHLAGKPVFAVLNRAIEAPGHVDFRALSSHLEFARTVVAVPADVLAARQLATGAFTWGRAPRSWQVGVRQLAAALVGTWEELGIGA